MRWLYFPECRHRRSGPRTASFRRSARFAPTAAVNRHASGLAARYARLVTDVTIRQAASGDADAIADLIASIDSRSLVSEISRNQRRDRFRHLIASGLNVSFLAVSDGRLIGELTLVLRDPAPTAIGFGVHPAWRRRGVARMLLDHGLKWASANEIHKVTAEVPADNVPAIALLRQAGFGEEGYLVNQFRRASGGATDAVLLARETAAHYATAS